MSIFDMLSPATRAMLEQDARTAEQVRHEQIEREAAASDRRQQAEAETERYERLHGYTRVENVARASAAGEARPAGPGEPGESPERPQVLIDGRPLSPAGGEPPRRSAAAERDALLRQARNPDPDSVVARAIAERDARRAAAESAERKREIARLEAEAYPQGEIWLNLLGGVKPSFAPSTGKAAQ